MKSTSLFDRIPQVVRRGECLVGGMVVLAAAILILPVSPGLMDFLLALNISLSVVLLLLALQVGETLKVAAFPTMLLVATLFRLALNVSTTRLILLRADAGEVVRSFGDFVVAGNPLVGGVLFVILTVVQFIVIAKGSERVAEVTARFTLDAMPGKQMSIDADLRAGAVDQQEAGRRRIRLERESQFHGSMDGAMKFVKGDAIAGMVITAVNILGGLLVGMLQRGMPAQEAVGTYTVLTIGDGLVSQIPALLISTAAGLVVTRVRSERKGLTLGRQIGQQIGSHPEVLFLSGGVLAVLGVVPGMPTLSFCILGVGLILAGALATRFKGAAGGEGNEQSLPRLDPVILQVDSRVSGDEALARSLELERSRIQEEIGVQVPQLEMVPSASRDRWTMLVHEVPVAAGSLKSHNHAGLAKEVGGALRRSASRFVGVQETQDMLDRLEKVQPALVREVVPRLVPTILLAEILARLVEEQVPVRNLRGILATLAEWARTEADPAALAERVRESLGAVISRQVAPEGKLEVLLLDPAVEQILEGAVTRTPNGTTLGLNPEDGQAILNGYERAAGTRGSAPIILTRPELRRPFWKLMSTTHPAVRVISFLELDPNTSIHPAGKIELAA
jgi:type III secretion protein V